MLNLNTSAVSTLNTNGARITDFNGGYYFEGKVYFTTFPSNTTFRGGIYAIDVQTLNVEPVVNSYFGLPFLSKTWRALSVVMLTYSLANQHWP